MTVNLRLFPRVLGHRRPKTETLERFAGVTTVLAEAGDLRRRENFVALDEE